MFLSHFCFWKNLPTLHTHTVHTHFTFYFISFRFIGGSIEDRAQDLTQAKQVPPSTLPMPWFKYIDSCKSAGWGGETVVHSGDGSVCLCGGACPTHPCVSSR